MKATLEFDLEDPDDIVSHIRSVKALDLSICLTEIRQELRSKLKYEDLSDHDTNLYECMQEKFFEILEDNNINLDELVL